MSGTYSIAKTSLSRVFLIEGRARGDHAPVYESCLRMTGISQGFGDVESIECPDPDNYGKFVEVGTIKGASERVTTSLEGRYALELKSDLLRLARKGCSLDVQLHIGECTDPKLFNSYKKAVIIEDALLSTYSTEDLGVLSQADEAAINETAEISAKRVYEVLPLTFGEKAASTVTNEVIDVVLCDSAACAGESCASESDGCQKFYALTKAAGGSPSSPADIVYSLNGGSTWYADNITSIGAAVEPTALGCIGNYLVVISQQDKALHYVLKAELDSIPNTTWTKVTTGIVTGGEPNAIDSTGTYAFIVGQSGYVYGTDDPTAGVTVLDAGVATADHLRAVDALSSTFAIAVGNNSTILKTTDGASWTEVTTTPTHVGTNYLCVAVKSKLEWWVGTSAGTIYYTTDGGVTWTASTFSGSGAGTVYDIVFATDSVAYMVHASATPRGRVFRSIDGGHTWVLCPEVTGTMPLSDRFNAVAACGIDPNLVCAVGLADNGSDGIIVIGEA